MHITKAELAAARRVLFARPRDDKKAQLDFAIRPISEAWRHVGRAPAFKTATANVAYIWRRADVDDRFGPMPGSFARDYDLRGSGLLLPGSAPQWAAEDFRLWIEADEATLATGDPTELASWHVMGGRQAQLCFKAGAKDGGEFARLEEAPAALSLHLHRHHVPSHGQPGGEATCLAGIRRLQRDRYMTTENSAQMEATAEVIERPTAVKMECSGHMRPGPVRPASPRCAGWTGGGVGAIMGTAVGPARLDRTPEWRKSGKSRAMWSG